MPNGFSQFWASYPKKVAKLDAMKAYEKARRTASADEILAGVHRYTAHMPDELRFVAHAATWLRAGRWMDEYDDKPSHLSATDWTSECQQLHGGTCTKRWDHEMLKRDSA